MLSDTVTSLQQKGFQSDQINYYPIGFSSTVTGKMVNSRDMIAKTNAQISLYLPIVPKPHTLY